MAADYGMQQMKELNDEARKAVNSAFDALNDWRNDMAAASERYSSKVFDQMTEATRAMGWPDDVVNATRQQLQNASRMQLQMMDQVMDAWKMQLRNPGTSFQMPQMPEMPGMPGMPDFSKGMGDLGGMASAPFQFWMQAAEMWQKNWASAMSLWMKGPTGLAEMMEQMRKDMGGR